MQKDLLKKIALEVGGQSAEGVVDILFGKKHVNEMIIAKKLKLTINQTRNVLYKLGDEGLVSFIRKKDSKKGGWYIYYWTLEAGKSLSKLKENLSTKIEELSSRLSQQKNERFFHCQYCDLEFNEEHSLLNDYHCSECGELLELKDSSEEIVQIEEEMKNLDVLLEKVNEEVGEWDKKEGKKRMRKAKAEEKKRAEKKAAQKKLREKLREKENKGKKKPKKKEKKKVVKKKAKKTTTFKKGSRSPKGKKVKKKVKKVSGKRK